MTYIIGTVLCLVFGLAFVWACRKRDDFMPIVATGFLWILGLAIGSMERLPLLPLLGLVVGFVLGGFIANRTD